MATMNISVPDLMRDWVQTQIEGGKYASVSDYVRDLIRRDQAATSDHERWLASLDAAIERGMADVAAGHVRDLDDVRAELKTRYADMTRQRSSR